MCGMKIDAKIMASTFMADIEVTIFNRIREVRQDLLNKFLTLYWLVMINEKIKVGSLYLVITKRKIFIRQSQWVKSQSIR